MTKYLLFLVAVAGLIFSNSGCTSKKADTNEQVVENADAEKIEADGLGAVEQDLDSSMDAAMGETPSATPPADVTSAAPTVDETSLNAGAVPTPTDAALAATIPDTAVSATTPEPTITETPVATVEATAVDTPSAAAAAEAIAPAETSTTTPAAEDVVAAEAAASEAKAATSAMSENLPKISGTTLRKIAETTPYQGKDGGWINTVYIARPNEKLDEISMKIYGTDKSNDLKNIAENSYLKSRAVKAGDKIYYVSPNRPDDSSKTILYYEDMGLIPETYVAKKGESLRKVSKELLGYDSAWKEVWTSNSVESKTSLKDGETLRYWKAAGLATAAAPTAPTAPPSTSGATLIDSAQAPEVTAQTTPPAAATEPSLPPPPADANANLPPPPADVAAAPVQAPDSAAAAVTEPSLPPPPAELAPPPPPPEAVAEAAPKKKVNLDQAAAEEEESEEGLDSDTMMAMAALGVLVALMAFVIIRKKKQKAEQMANEMSA